MPGGMPWVKIYTEMLDDPKVAKLPDATMWRFIQLILVAAECDAGGAFVVGDKEMTIQDIAWRLRKDKSILESDIKLLLSAGIITKDGKIIEIPKFTERQGPAQKEKRATWNERQQKRRARVTRDTRVSHALEKSREDIEKDVDMSTGDFAKFNDTFQEKTRLTNYTPQVAIKAFEDITKAGATIEDMIMAIEQMIEKSYVLVSPASIVNPTINCMNFRLRKPIVNNQSSPKMAWDILPDGTSVAVEVKNG
jgi:hypothetical protein